MQAMLTEINTLLIESQPFTILFLTSNWQIGQQIDILRLSLGQLKLRDKSEIRAKCQGTTCEINPKRVYANDKTEIYNRLLFCKGGLCIYD